MVLFAAIVALGFAVRALAGIFLGDIDPRSATLWEYGEIARNMLEHERMVRVVTFSDGETLVYPTAYMPPGHVYLWYLLFSIFGNTSQAISAMLAINILLSTVLVFLVGIIAQRVFNWRAVTILSMLLIGLYPTFVYSVITYHAIQIYLVLLLLGFWLTLDLMEKPRLRTTVLLGVVGGLAAFWRVEYIVLFAGLMVLAWVRHRQISLFAIGVLCSALVILPWTARNYVVLDRFVPVANSTGYNLWKGFSSEANGSGDWIESSGLKTAKDSEFYEILPHDEDFESNLQAAYLDEALEFIRDEPVQAFIELPAKKLVLFWIFDFYDPAITLQPVYLAAFVPTFILTVAGIVLVIRRRLLSDGVQAMFVIFVAQTIVTLGYAVHARYRLNVEPFLFIFAAYAAADLLSRILPDRVHAQRPRR